MIKPILLPVCLLMLIGSCHVKSPSIPSSSGGNSEVLVIADAHRWKGTLGDTIKAMLQLPYQALSQPEPSFKVLQMTPKAFNEMLQKHRNLVILEIGQDHAATTVEAKRDVWARPQVVIRIQAPSQAEAYRAFAEKQMAFIRLFDEVERQRIMNAFARTQHYKVQDFLKKNYGLSMTIPGSFYIAKKTDQFIWLRNETKKYSQGILVYFQAYTDTAQFSPRQIIAQLDSITKQHIPGPVEGSYMTTEKEFRPTSARTRKDERFTVVTSGLWKLGGGKAFLGGPFINHTLVDEHRNRLVSIHGYVMAPNQPKRDLLKQVEAIMHSVKL